MDQANIIKVPYVSKLYYNVVILRILFMKRIVSIIKYFIPKKY